MFMLRKVDRSGLFFPSLHDPHTLITPLFPFSFFCDAIWSLSHIDPLHPYVFCRCDIAIRSDRKLHIASICVVMFRPYVFYRLWFCNAIWSEIAISHSYVSRLRPPCFASMRYRDRNQPLIANRIIQRSSPVITQTLLSCDHCRIDPIMIWWSAFISFICPPITSM